MTGWRATLLVLLLNLTLLASVLAAHVSRAWAERRRALARVRVRSVLTGLAKPSQATALPDLAWWLAHAEAVQPELTTSLAAVRSVRSALEGVASAAAAEVLRRIDTPRVSLVPGRRRAPTRLRRAAQLVTLAPTRATRRALLALQAGGDPHLGMLASAALARHATVFADTSTSMAYFIARGPGGPRALAARWALQRVIVADRRRAAVHLGDETAAVRSVALAGLPVDGAEAERQALVQRALASTSDRDADVRAAAFDALPRVSRVVPHAEVERGLEDASDAVRFAAARALPFVDGDALALLPALERTDASLGRIVRLAMRARPASFAPAAPSGRTAVSARVAFFERLTAVPVAEAEPAATEALGDAEATVRREAALALAALARTRTATRLQSSTIEALLHRLGSESAAPVSAALVEALEASGDERAAEQLSVRASRARLTWRLRLTEAAALARHLRAAADRPATDRPSPDRTGRPGSQTPMPRPSS